MASSNLYTGFADAAAARYGIPTDLFKRQIAQESGWNSQAIGSKGEIGLGQIMPSTGAMMGYSPTDLADPETNLNAAAYYLKKMKDKFGSWREALAAYNGGPGNRQAGYGYADKILSEKDGVPGLSEEETSEFSFSDPSTWVPAILSGVKPYAIGALLIIIALALIFAGIRNGFINVGK